MEKNNAVAKKRVVSKAFADGNKQRSAEWKRLLKKYGAIEGVKTTKFSWLSLEIRQEFHKWLAEDVHANEIANRLNLMDNIPEDLKPFIPRQIEKYKAKRLKEGVDLARLQNITGQSASELLKLQKYIEATEKDLKGEYNPLTGLVRMAKRYEKLIKKAHVKWKDAPVIPATLHKLESELRQVYNDLNNMMNKSVMAGEPSSWNINHYEQNNTINQRPVDDTEPEMEVGELRGKLRAILNTRRFETIGAEDAVITRGETIDVEDNTGDSKQ